MAFVSLILNQCLSFADDPSWSWAVLVLYLIGKFGASIAFFVVNVYTTELFPTAVRATMMGLGLLVGKAASIVAPEVPLLVSNLNARPEVRNNEVLSPKLFISRPHTYT